MTEGPPIRGGRDANPAANDGLGGTGEWDSSSEPRAIPVDWIPTLGLTPPTCCSPWWYRDRQGAGGMVNTMGLVAGFRSAQVCPGAAETDQTEARVPGSGAKEADAASATYPLSGRLHSVQQSPHIGLLSRMAMRQSLEVRVSLCSSDLELR